MAHEDEAGQGLHGSASMWKFADGSAWDDAKTSCSDDEA